MPPRRLRSFFGSARLFAKTCVLSAVLSGCDAPGDATGAQGQAASGRVELSPEAVQVRLNVKGANVSMGETEVNGQRLSQLRCAGVKRPLLGGMAIIGALAKQKAALDACAQQGDAAVATWTSQSGPLQALKVAGSASAGTDACIQAALAKVESPFPATCAAVVLIGEAAGADTAAKALLGES